MILLLAVPETAGESTWLIRKRVSEVRLTLVATDADGRALPSLSPSDITVLEDGHPVSRFDLRSASDLPLQLGIVIDLSESTQKTWPAIRAALINSLGRIVRPEDEVQLLMFDSKIEFEQPISAPAQIGSLFLNSRNGGLTALYDAVYRACDYGVFNSNDGPQPRRSALILFSDGEDDLSRHSLLETIAKAESTGVTIYTISTHDPRLRMPGDAILREFAAATGGQDFVVQDGQQLQDALSAISSELRSSYVLYYRSPEESGTREFRRIHVTPVHGDGARVRSRSGYFTAP